MKGPLWGERPHKGTANPSLATASRHRDGSEVEYIPAAVTILETGPPSVARGDSTGSGTHLPGERRPVHHLQPQCVVADLCWAVLLYWKATASVAVITLGPIGLVGTLDSKLLKPREGLCMFTLKSAHMTHSFACSLVPDGLIFLF